MNNKDKQRAHKVDIQRFYELTGDNKSLRTLSKQQLLMVMNRSPDKEWAEYVKSYLSSDYIGKK